MIPFILIVFIKSGYAGGAFSQEFSSQQACESAKVAVLAEMGSTFRSIDAICVSK